MAVKRLKSARGHLDGVIRMLEADRYCMDVLHQLTAVEGAIARAHREILETHARGCVVDAMRDGRIEDAIEEVLSAVYGDRSPAGRGATRAVQ
jgi:DNA-binding FrmR family transcriptional regulator